MGMSRGSGARGVRLRGWQGVEQHPCVLIVDDDEAIRDSLRLVLEDAGYSTCDAEDGTTALARLREDGSGMVVLLDLIMPGMDGEELLYVITGDSGLSIRHSYILMTAAHQRLTPDITSILARVSAPILEKPFDLDSLLSLVALAGQRLSV